MTYMAFPLPPHVSKSEINRAGQTLNTHGLPVADYVNALHIVNQWRACHAYPINTFQSTLRLKVKDYDGAIVAQRLKRLPTITDKLERYPNMMLARMQDIGGVRAILKNLAEVRELKDLYKNKIRFGHKLVREDDYIQNPRADGYRSVHLVYKYSNGKSPYNGLLLELQMRTRLQHIWATAVETMGTFKGQALKSRQGDKEWLEFFAVTASAFAHQEKTTLIPGYEHLSRKETHQAVAKAEAELNVLRQIAGYSTAMNVISDRGESQKSSYHLLVLESEKQVIRIASYGRDELKEASAAYANAEQDKNAEAVLVSAGSLDQLRRASQTSSWT